ncbi:MAG: alanine racemase [Nitriliruptorales bacterium]|nr:alanine racemase [Nitriliruptorales bacterium]
MTTTDQTGSTRIQTGGTGQRHARTEPPNARPTWAEIDLDAIADNVAALKTQAAAPQLMAVVKANGYGHGAVPAARAAVAGGADWLAVALAEEGRQLRDAGIDTPILVMTEPPPEAVNELLTAALTPTVFSRPYAAALEAAARERGGEPVAVHLKLDTGMRRVGVPQADWEDALTFVRDAQGLRLEAIWSHFAVADEPFNPFITHQAEEFARALGLARSLRVAYDLAHLCNSAGTLHLHEHHYDMVRPGLAIYGLEPAPGLAGKTALRPALSWWTRLSLVKRLAAGEAVSYGLRWTAPRETTVGTIPAGYADGVTRALSNRGEAVVRAHRVPIVGTVCMDQFMVDGGDLPLAAGDDVALIGREGTAEVTADDWAAWLDTINYEVVCGVGQRVPRVYVGDVRW